MGVLPDLSHNATLQSPSCGWARRPISRLSFTHHLSAQSKLHKTAAPSTQALGINYTCGWGDFQGHYQDRGRGCEGRKDRTERGDGIVGCGGETWAETCPLRAAQCDTSSLRLHAEGRQQGPQPMWSTSRLQEWRGSFLKRHWQRDPSELTGRDIQYISHITPFHYPTRQSKSCLGKAACWDITKVHLLLALTLHPVFPCAA